MKDRSIKSENKSEKKREKINVLVFDENDGDVTREMK